MDREDYNSGNDRHLAVFRLADDDTEVVVLSGQDHFHLLPFKHRGDQSLWSVPDRLPYRRAECLSGGYKVRSKRTNAPNTGWSKEYFLCPTDMVRWDEEENEWGEIAP